MILDLTEVEETFRLLEQWEDRYRYIIDLGKNLGQLEPHLRTDENRVLGCASQVWMVSELDDKTSRLRFRGDSDAHIVRGLIALVLAYYDDHAPTDILTRDVSELFTRLDLQSHISSQRANGVRSMVNRIMTIAHEQATQGATA
jgi:cysteine desulfuration protein SufE